jgi:hypothetical protein
VIAESEEKIMFVSIPLKSYVDLLFTRPDFQRRGIADTPIIRRKTIAEMGVTKPDDPRKCSSRPFFEKKGFVLQEERPRKLYGVTF